MQVDYVASQHGAHVIVDDNVIIRDRLVDLERDAETVAAFNVAVLVFDPGLEADGNDLVAIDRVAPADLHDCVDAGLRRMPGLRSNLDRDPVAQRLVPDAQDEPVGALVRADPEAVTGQVLFLPRADCPGGARRATNAARHIGIWLSVQDRVQAFVGVFRFDQGERAALPAVGVGCVVHVDEAVRREVLGVHFKARQAPAADEARDARIDIVVAPPAPERRDREHERSDHDGWAIRLQGGCPADAEHQAARTPKAPVSGSTPVAETAPEKIHDDHETKADRRRGALSALWL